MKIFNYVFIFCLFLQGAIIITVIVFLLEDRPRSTALYEKPYKLSEKLIVQQNKPVALKEKPVLLEKKPLMPTPIRENCTCRCG